MTDTLPRRAPRRQPSGLSAYGLLMEYERAVAEAVEATLAEGLRQSQAPVDARTRAAAAWRDPLTLIAAEELSRRLALQATRGARPAIGLSALKRALKPHAVLVAIAARTEMARSPQAVVAAD